MLKNQNFAESPIWINGGSRCGKTTLLIEKFTEWVQKLSLVNSRENVMQKSVLVFAANDSNRRQLADQLSTCIKKSYPIIAKTPLGFINEEVTLFYPLIAQELNLKSLNPIRLRPETEQELATKLWRNQFLEEDLLLFGGEYRFVRRILDLLQLAGAAGIAPEEIPHRLQNGLENTFTGEIEKDELWQRIGILLLNWRKYCLDRGLLSYSLIYELYWRYLLPNEFYQEKLISRHTAIFADDTDDYPAISADLFDLLLNNGFFGFFTYNPNGKVRLGLNADPNYFLKRLSSRCQVQNLDSPHVENVGTRIAEQVIQLISEPVFGGNNIDAQYLQFISGKSRAKLLRETAEFIIKSIEAKDIKPDEIAIIAPGLDDIGRYTLINILESHNIPIEPLNEQHPLISSSLIRALLTLLGLVYQGLGRFVLQEAIAEMLVVFSQNSSEKEAKIDPVRAGLLADYCYHIDLELPCLLPVETYRRWDRLGYEAVESYNQIWQWIETIKNKRKEDANFSPMILFDLAMKRFFLSRNDINYADVANLRELIETAQHFWEVQKRLQKEENNQKSQTQIIIEFMQLLQKGTITANPYPLKPEYTPVNLSPLTPLQKGENEVKVSLTKGDLEGLNKNQGYVTLANVYQYRALRSHHRWQFWLDIGSNLWSKSGSSELFASPLFLREWNGNPWQTENQLIAEEERLKRIIRDLLARATEKVYLCHSELSINGTEEKGVLLNLLS